MHAAELVRRVVDERRAKVVVMNVATYEEWRASLALLQLLAHAQADVEAGRGGFAPMQRADAATRHPRGVSADSNRRRHAGESQIAPGPSLNWSCLG